MVGELFAGSERRVEHEYCSREFYHNFCEYKETGEPSRLAELERLVANCSNDCIVGNGYAPVLPLFAQKYGRRLRLVHLRRKDRQGCIASLVRNAELFPMAYGYYFSSSAAQTKRIAAFHFGEMSVQEWTDLSLETKISWFYDKTLALVEQYSELFDDYIEINTEDLNTEASRRALARAVGIEDQIPHPAHLNAMQAIVATIDPKRRNYFNWLLGRLNFTQVATDEVMALNYFIEKYVAWTGYQITRAPQIDSAEIPPAATIDRNLDRAEARLLHALKEVAQLRLMLRERNHDIRD